ncbi:MAG: DNA-binding protein [Polyangiaceae bacterium]|nr:DNA-binding protein [Polyangiaceae bacterium]
MKVVEAHRTRHIVLRLDRGDELPGAIVRALEEADVRAAWIEGFGTIEFAELAVFDPKQRSYAKARRIEGGGDAVSIKGNASLLDSSLCVRLFASIARETETGLQMVGGELLGGRAFAVELWVTSFEDASLARVVDDRTGQLALVRGSGPARVTTPEAPREESTRTQAASSAVQVSAAAKQSSPSIVEMARQAMGDAPAPLAPPKRTHDDFSETYPEVGDLVTHFHFGECKIISSDGDKIRLQQLKDLRVREVALSALKTELVSEDTATNQRTFRLLRKTERR